MLGPLPPLYRWVVCSLALVVCAGLGAWLAWSLPVPVLAPESPAWEAMTRKSGCSSMLMMR